MSRDNDPAEGRRRMRDGMARAERHCNPVWKAAYEAMIIWVAENNLYFTTAGVALTFRAAHPNLFTHEPRASGPLMGNARRAGIMKKVITADRPLDPRPSCHRGPLELWKSLIFKGYDADNVLPVGRQPLVSPKPARPSLFRPPTPPKDYRKK